MSQSYSAPQATLERSIEIKKSRFIARAGFANTREVALAFVADMRRDYADARHHCWAYLVGNPATAASAGMNDDGEPAGTAGKPILNVIQHKGLGDVVVVVTRYFGGVKLGAGGLVRAYAGASEAVLSRLPVAAIRPRLAVKLQLDFAKEQSLRHWAAQHNASIEAIIYAQAVELTLSVQAATLFELKAFCAAQAIQVMGFVES